MDKKQIRVTPDEAFPRPRQDAWDAECTRAREDFQARLAAGEVDDLELFLVEHAEGKS
jgi:hypothetical protein